MSERPSRDRGNGYIQRFERIRPIAFDGTTKLEHREGGAYPLYVKETRPGTYVSAWMIDTKVLRQFVKEMNRKGSKVTLSLVVDTNVPGHPTVSMQLQETFVD